MQDVIVFNNHIMLVLTGQTIQIRTPSGQLMSVLTFGGRVGVGTKHVNYFNDKYRSVQVPVGVTPGGTFQVQVPMPQPAWSATPQSTALQVSEQAVSDALRFLLFASTKSTPGPCRSCVTLIPQC